MIVDYVGGTSVGPAAAFREIVRSITLNEKRILSVASPVKFENVPEEVCVSIPSVVGRKIRLKLEMLTEDEINGIKEAARQIYEVYRKFK